MELCISPFLLGRLVYLREMLACELLVFDEHAFYSSMDANTLLLNEIVDG